VADGVVEGYGLRALESLVLQGASDADALLCVGDGDETIRKFGLVADLEMKADLSWSREEGDLQSSTY
jgi:hypothetical protein